MLTTCLILPPQVPHSLFSYDRAWANINLRHTNGWFSQHRSFIYLPCSSMEVGGGFRSLWFWRSCVQDTSYCYLTAPPPPRVAVFFRAVKPASQHHVHTPEFGVKKERTWKGNNFLLKLNLEVALVSSW